MQCPRRLSRTSPGEEDVCIKKRRGIAQEIRKSRRQKKDPERYNRRHKVCKIL
jgi:hypothetical protein